MVFVMRVVSAAAALVLAAASAANAAGSAAGDDPAPTRADIAADALRQEPVYISPHLDPGAVGPQDMKRLHQSADRLKAAGIPVFVSVSPVWDGDGSGEFGVAYLALLHDRLRKDGAYVHVDANGRTQIRAYGVRPAGSAETVSNRLRGWADDPETSLADLAVLAVDGLRTGQVPTAPSTTGDDMAYIAPQYRAEKAALVVGTVGAVAVAVLGLLHRFTDLPLWPRRRRQAPADPAVDWRSAPELPDPTYETLYELADRRLEALTLALATASSARLPVAGSVAAIAQDLADDLVICCLPAGFETEDEEGRAVLEAIDLPDIVAAIELGRIGMLALAALRDGVPYEHQPPCFYHPLHERGAEVVPYPGRDGEVDVMICPSCAERGPEPLLTRFGGEMVPYYESDDVNPVWRQTGYGAANTPWDAGRLLAVFATWVDEGLEDGEADDAAQNADVGEGARA
ncbi:hypothetical protein [Streptomyces sp. NPDC020681]|uniref:hypothetical protein n=1 Tax=Streptomyces sp. NPDC020681 TaxID=3365083 RepID=UPI0037AA3A68